MTETPTERNRRIFQEATEAGEPVFVIRAKDRHGPDAISAYGALTSASGLFYQALIAIHEDFVTWQEAHPDKVKTPDLRT